MLRLARPDDKPEIFYTIQGEGRNLGRPSVFIRASLCNLHCVWCDTDYTWNWRGTRFAHVRDTEPGYEKYELEAVSVEMSVAEVAQKVRAFPCRTLVLTGGEPMLQQADWVELLDVLRADGYAWHAEVETNGTRLPTDAFDAAVDQYNVSPKLANSGVREALRLKPKVLQYFAQHPKAYFKFVVAAAEDVPELLTLIDRYGIPAERIYLMPEGTDPATLRARRESLIELCKTHGFWFTDRLHVQVWGKKRGV